MLLGGSYVFDRENHAQLVICTVVCRESELFVVTRQRFVSSVQSSVFDRQLVVAVKRVVVQTQAVLFEPLHQNRAQPTTLHSRIAPQLREQVCRYLTIGGPTHFAWLDVLVRNHLDCE